MDGFFYDRQFHQIAALCPDTMWARRENDLWNAVFTGGQRRPYCQNCFGSTHSSEQCCMAPEVSTIIATSRPRAPRICREWNYSQCSFIDCRFVHACFTCYNDPQSRGRPHKWIHCHRNPDWHRTSGTTPSVTPGGPHQHPYWGLLLVELRLIKCLILTL